VASSATTTASEGLRGKLAAEAAGDSAYAAEADATAVRIVEHRPSIFETMAEAWRSRHLFMQLASSAFMAYFSKYRLGPFWLFFQTFMSIAGYSLIFGGGVFNVKAPNGMPYFLYMMVGMMGWQLFLSTMMISAMSFIRLRAFVRDIHIPLVLIPIAGSAIALMRFALMLIGYVIAVIYFWAHDGRLYAQLQPKYLLFSVLGLFLCVTLAWGISLWTAPMTAHTRDVRYLLRYLLPFWMFVTPVLYPIEKLHGKTRLVAELNPLSAPIEMAKVGLVGAGSVRLFAAIWSIAAIALVFTSGVWFISRVGPKVLRKEEDEGVMDDTMMM
jgi:lipopolysaccharide transport system permease protein